MRAIASACPAPPALLFTSRAAGAEMHSWYDLHGLSSRAAEPCKGIEDTRSMLDHMIGLEIEGGISERRIVLGGFSQGGASALYSGVRQPHGLAGPFLFSARRSSRCVHVWVTRVMLMRHQRCLPRVHHAGIMGLSSYLPLPQLTKDLSLSPAAKRTPIFLSRCAYHLCMPYVRA